jgi:hypothetical protein
MNRFLLIILGAFSIDAIAGTVETSICFHNYTEKSHLIKIADIENYDWSSNIHRPDKNLHQVRIKPNETICRREYVNSWSKDPNFTLIVDDVPSRMRYSAADKNTVDAWNVQVVREDRLGNQNPAPVIGWGKSPFGDDWQEGDYNCQITPPASALPGCWGFFIGDPF